MKPLSAQDTFKKFLALTPDNAELTMDGIPVTWDNDRFKAKAAPLELIPGEHPLSLRNLKVNGTPIVQWINENITDAEKLNAVFA